MKTLKTPLCLKGQSEAPSRHVVHTPFKDGQGLYILLTSAEGKKNCWRQIEQILLCTK